MNSILVVDLSETASILMDLYLRFSGFNPTTFSGPEASKQAEIWLKTNSPEAALLDIELPNPNGIVLANLITSLDAQAIIVFLTSLKPSNSLIEEASKLNFPIIFKPAKLGPIAEWIKRRSQIECQTQDPKTCPFNLKQNVGNMESCTHCITKKEF